MPNASKKEPKGKVNVVLTQARRVRKAPVVSTKGVGRPSYDGATKLTRLGLYLAPDKVKKLAVLKKHAGISVRDWVEGQIEVAYAKLKA